MNPRDALKEDLVAVNLHHILRRGTITAHLYQKVYFRMMARSVEAYSF
jgi:hypothetical protein